MGLRLTFELDDEDLRHFRLIMQEARRAMRRASPEEIVSAAGARLDALRQHRAPAIVVQKADRLRLLMRMLADIDWRLPHEDAERILNALAYFAEPEDLIPDDIPGVGFLDDAIMIELVMRELRHEIEAYEDFCAFLESTPGARAATIEKRRTDLHSRMRRRATGDDRTAGLGLGLAAQGR